MLILQSIGSLLCRFISPWLESWPENNSAAITICCDCGFGATLQHLCYTVNWGTLKETFLVYIPSLHLLSRCSLQHCSPTEDFGPTSRFLSLKAFMYTQNVEKYWLTECKMMGLTVQICLWGHIAVCKMTAHSFALYCGMYRTQHFILFTHDPTNSRSL